MASGLRRFPGFRSCGWLVVLGAMAASGCRRFENLPCTPYPEPQSEYDPIYGPNPLAECLHWPKDAPRVRPLYGP